MDYNKSHRSGRQIKLPAADWLAEVGGNLLYAENYSYSTQADFPSGAQIELLSPECVPSTAANAAATVA